VALTPTDPDSTTITADLIKYDRTTQIAEGTGNLVIQQGGLEIKAPQGTYRRKESQSILSGGVTLRDPSQDSDSTVLADFQLAQANPSPTSADQEVTIVADKLTYDRTTQVAQGEGNLEIKQGDTVIDAPQGSYRRKDSQSILVGGVTLREPQRVLKSDRLTGNHKDKIFLFEDNVVYTQLPDDSPAKPDPNGKPPLTDELRRAQTEVKATKLVYNSRTGVSEFTDAVQFTQKGRQAKANKTTINPDKVILEGDVSISQIQGDWLAKRFEDSDTQKAVARPTLIFADRVEIDQKTSDARFFDNVVIVQANRAAEGDNATYSDGKQLFALASDSVPVMLCDRGDKGETSPNTVEGLPGRDALDVTCRGANQIRSKLITLDMANDTFSADGQSSMQFRVSGDQAL
jgi:lipopolysaccharide export system protein LptA